MKEQLGLIENPKRKTVFFGEVIDEISYEHADLLDSDIIDAEIREEPIRIKLDDEF